MNPKFNKLALAASIGASLGATAIPVHATLENIAGEALLVAPVAYDATVGSFTINNTLINLSMPGSIGAEAVVNVYSAPNSTPTNPVGANPVTAALLPESNSGRIHWYFFDENSKHQFNSSFTMTPNDIATIDWKEVANGRVSGEIGYLILGNEGARSGKAADFAFAGEAWLDMSFDGFMGPASTPVTITNEKVQIPVLTMIDGPDDTGTDPSVADMVKYSQPQGIPRAASPLYSGMLTNFADGILDDTIVFDMSLGNRNIESMHVMWLDQNAWGALDTEIFDSNEERCSWTGGFGKEMNLVTQYPLWDSRTACEPVAYDDDSVPVGFVKYFAPEYYDAGTFAPEVSGFGFSFIVVPNDDGYYGITTEDAVSLGAFKYREAPE